MARLKGANIYYPQQMNALLMRRKLAAFCLATESCIAGADDSLSTVDYLQFAENIGDVIAYGLDAD